MARPMTPEDSYVTFRGVSVTVGATSNYCRAARGCAGAGACIEGMLRRCFQDTMDCLPVQWVYVLDSGQRSSVTVNRSPPTSPPTTPRNPHPLTPPLVLLFCGGRPREDRTPTPPRIPGSTCRCLYVLIGARVCSNRGYICTPIIYMCIYMYMYIYIYIYIYRWIRMNVNATQAT